MKYRKKPIVIEAQQYDGTVESIDWLHGELMKGNIKKFVDGLYIKTLEGFMQVSIGDFFIKGIIGEIYPCKPDIFAQIYEKVIEDGE